MNTFARCSLLLAALCLPGPEASAQTSHGPGVAMIAAGQSVQGTLSASDVRRDDGSYADVWHFHGQPGQRIEIRLSSDDFDAFLQLGEGLGENPRMVASDDDGGGGTNARIVAVLTGTEQWIWANSLGAGETGAYTLSLRVLEAPDERFVRERATPIRVGDTLRGRLEAGDPEAGDGSFYDAYVYTAAAAGERVSILLSSDEFDAYLMLGQLREGVFHELATNDDVEDGTDAGITFAFPAAGEYLIRANSLSPGETGAYALRVTGAGTSSLTTPSRAAPRTIMSGQTVTGTLSSSDPKLADDSYVRDYLFTARRDQRVVIDLKSSDFDAYLAVGRSGGDGFSRLVSDDDSGGGTDARIEFTFPAEGTYVIRVNSLRGGEQGSFMLRVEAAR